ncbi:MAG: phage tail protein, partial [Caulobacteraceae bacterium]|nr:phage tail protein [Caulobacteraceae bacterium]
ATDWTQLPDAPVADHEAWAAYRQALRDVPEQPGFPAQIEWPTAPGGDT